MHPVIALALASMPAGTETPRTQSYKIPESFNVDRDSLRFCVHIRTKTPTYQSGFTSSAAKENWERDCINLMNEIGFVKEKGWFYPVDGSRTDYLYAHPDDISGVITLHTALLLHAAIERGDYGFQNRAIDVYEVYEDLSVGELWSRNKVGN